MNRKLSILAVFVLGVVGIGISVFIGNVGRNVSENYFPTPVPECPAKKANPSWEKFESLVELEVPTSSGPVEASFQQYVDELSMVFIYDGEMRAIPPPCIAVRMPVGFLVLEAFIDYEGNIYLSRLTAMLVKGR